MTRPGLNLLLACFALPVLAACAGDSGSSSGRRTLIQNKGSETLNEVAQAWAERYTREHPGVAIAVSAGGSGFGIDALISGTVDLANASREILPSERRAAEARGIQPVEFLVGFDALAVFLHADNPLDSVSLETLASIFGAQGTVSTWEELGVQIPGCPSGRIRPLGRPYQSGTYRTFLEEILGEGGSYRPNIPTISSAEELRDQVMADPCAIGYGGLAFLREGMRAPCLLSTTPEAPSCVPPTVETALSGSYPISRPLFMYTAGTPSRAVADYLDWIMGDAGQCVLLETGYAPIRTGLRCGERPQDP